jgi:hypothetical protein
MPDADQTTATTLWEMAPRRDRNHHAVASGETTDPIGAAFALSIPVAAAIVHIDFGNIGGLNFGGWVWTGYLLVAILVILRHVSKGSGVSFPCAPWFAWLGLVWISIAWLDGPRGRGVQDALQISSPVVMGIVGSLCIRTPEQLRTLLRITAAMAAMLATIFVARRVGVLHQGEDPAENRVMAITLALAGSVLLAGFPQRKVWPLIGWAGCVVLGLVSGSRMATMALVWLPIFHPGYRGITWRLLIAAAALVVAIGLFYTPYFQTRFFYTGSGTLQDLMRGEFLSYGRFETWPEIWDEAWKRPMLGAGVGSTFTFVPTVWERMHHIHNDYLRVGFELGLVGLTLWLTVLLWQLLDLRRWINRTQGVLQHAFKASLLALVAFATIAATDNILIYNAIYTNAWFVVMGAAYGVLRSTSGHSDKLSETGPEGKL